MHVLYRKLIFNFFSQIVLKSFPKWQINYIVYVPCKFMQVMFNKKKRHKNKYTAQWYENKEKIEWLKVLGWYVWRDINSF